MSKVILNNVKNRFLPIQESVLKGLEPEPKISDFDIIKRLEDENRELHRKLKNAEDRYIKLLWEYTDYKEGVKTAYFNYEVAEKVRNQMMKELWNTI